MSDAQLWFVRLQKEGYGYSTITSIRGVLRPAFQMAFNENIILKPWKIWILRGAGYGSTTSWSGNEAAGIMWRRPRPEAGTGVNAEKWLKIKVYEGL